MPSSLGFALEPLGPSLTPRSTLSPLRHARGLHALVFRWLHEADPAVSGEVHDEMTIKPFTVSPIFRDGAGYHFRVTILDDRLEGALLDGFRRLVERGGMVEFGEDAFRLTLPVAEVAKRWTAAATYEELERGSAREPTVTLVFASPTSFRRQSKNYPLPDPVLVFQSLANRWNAFAENKVDTALLIGRVGAGVAVSRARVQTVATALGNVKQIGFVGQAVYRMEEGRRDDGGTVSAGAVTDHQWLHHWANVLADFSFYSGVGYKCALGFGQCWHVPGWNALADVVGYRW